MSIRLLDYRAVQIAFRPNNELIKYLENIETLEQLPGINYVPLFHGSDADEDEKTEFLIHFDFTLDFKKSEDDHTGLFKLDFVARFKSSIEITQEFMDSNFPRVNAPAISYPFLRAFVNNFFINAGYNPVLLPTYNFTKSVQSNE